MWCNGIERKRVRYFTRSEIYRKMRVVIRSFRGIFTGCIIRRARDRQNQSWVEGETPTFTIIAPQHIAESLFSLFHDPVEKSISRFFCAKKRSYTKRSAVRIHLSPLHIAFYRARHWYRCSFIKVLSFADARKWSHTKFEHHAAD